MEQGSPRMERSAQGFEPSTPAPRYAGEKVAPQLAPAGPDGPMSQAIAALQAHPRFAAATRVAATGLVDLWRGNRMLNTMVSDRIRLFISMHAVYLHSLSRPNDPHSGLTVSRMIALCTEQKLCSPGRAKAVLMLMRVLGHLAPAPNEADRRLRRLVPTELLMALHRERSRRLFEAIAMVLPEHAEVSSTQSHPDFTAFYICRYCERFLAGFRFVDFAPDIRHFWDHNAGFIILCHMMLSGEADDTYPPTRPLPISLSVLSRRFGVSRRHVRRLLQKAETEGLLERLDGDLVQLLPRLVQAANDFMATHFLIAADCAKGALADIGRESAAA
jgi:AraC-like DNA-binding protein